jgi:hypothetical protein
MEGTYCASVSNIHCCSSSHPGSVATDLSEKGGRAALSRRESTERRQSSRTVEGGQKDN